MALLFTVPVFGKSKGEREACARGDHAYSEANYEEAIRQYRQALTGKELELKAKAQYNIGVCLYELYRTSEAIDQYRAASDVLNGRYPKALYALGVALEDLNKVAEARTAYRQAIESSGGKYAEAFYRLGVVNALLGDPETAGNSFAQAIAQANGYFPASHNNLGVTLAQRGFYAKAEREFELALLQTGGDYDDARHNLALCRSLLNPASVAHLVISSSKQNEMKVKLLLPTLP